MRCMSNDLAIKTWFENRLSLPTLDRTCNLDYNTRIFFTLLLQNWISITEVNEYFDLIERYNISPYEKILAYYSIQWLVDKYDRSHIKWLSAYVEATRSNIWYLVSDFFDDIEIKLKDWMMTYLTAFCLVNWLEKLFPTWGRSIAIAREYVTKFIIANQVFYDEEVNGWVIK